MFSIFRSIGRLEDWKIGYPSFHPSILPSFRSFRSFHPSSNLWKTGRLEDWVPILPPLYPSTLPSFRSFRSFHPSSNLWKTGRLEDWVPILPPLYPSTLPFLPFLPSFLKPTMCFLISLKNVHGGGVGRFAHRTLRHRQSCKVLETSRHSAYRASFCVSLTKGAGQV